MVRNHFPDQIEFSARSARPRNPVCLWVANAASRFRQALAEKSFNGYTSVQMCLESKSYGFNSFTHVGWRGRVAMRVAIAFACLLFAALLNPASLSPAFASGLHDAHAMTLAFDEAPPVAHVSSTQIGRAHV